LIYALNESDDTKRKWLINSIKNHNRNKKRVKEVISYVKEKGGLDYAVSKMMHFKDEALEILNSYPDSDHKAALTLMVNYVVDRKK
ncbi:MAG: polyprenyl synthetase family protein, partial [Bacteroidota bacterium]